MRVEPLNHSRQLAADCIKLALAKGVPQSLKDPAEDAVRLHGASQKFLLPAGGRLLDDLEYRALDESQTLRLPFPVICLEYTSNGKERPEDEPVCFVNGQAQYETSDWVSAPKRVVYAEEIDGWIQVTVCFWTRHDASWRVLPKVAIPVMDYLDRGTVLNGRVGIKYAMQDERIPGSDYMDEVGALMCFLNALQCSNVGTEIGAKARPTPKKAKSALPFDEYHVLTVELPRQAPANGALDGSTAHRSPREHLRRGHIRRLADGRRIWVNAAVIGRGAAALHKSYSMKGAA
jgi:hypothetical protein